MTIDMAAWGIVLALLTHTGALFYWGGKMAATLASHDLRLQRLEKHHA